MKVTVKLFASFKEASGAPQSVLEVAPGTTVGGVWQTLLGEYPRLVPLGHSVGMAVNGKYTQPEVAVSDGDVVAFLPPVSGG